MSDGLELPRRQMMGWKQSDMITCTRADDRRASGLAGQQPRGREAGRQSGTSADKHT